MRAITGVELTLDDGTHLTLLCEDRTGYRNLCRLITLAHQGTRAWQEPRGRETPAVALEEVERHAEGLICLSGCAGEGALAGRVAREEHAAATGVGRRLLDAFGPDRFRVELQRLFLRGDRRRNRLLTELAERLGVPVVATGNVHVHHRSRAPLQDAFVAVRRHATLDESEPMRRGNTSHALASPVAMAKRFADHPEAVHESGRLAKRLRFDLTHDLGYRYPGADDGSADHTLAELCRHRLGDRYAGRARREEAAARLEEELAVIRALGLSGFFLLHRDLLELAREVAVEVRGPDSARAVLPPGRGRGSSVSSIVCYLTGLSHVDPVAGGLLLGRFLNEDLTAVPDIDLDFPRDIREVLIPRVHERYGHDRSALVAAHTTYRTRSAIRDFGKVLGLPPGEIERAARGADPWGGDRAARDIAESVGERRAGSPRWRALAHLVSEAADLPRHLSQHPGGMVISTEPLIDLCPVQPAAMEGRQMVQWDKDSCADAGFLKIDLLGLGMLSAVERCVDQIAAVRGETIDLSRIAFDDGEVYREIQAAETMGVFQIESRAQMQMLRRTLPESLDDLTVQVALVRPGPILGGAVHPYIERKKALREDPSYRVPYEHPSLEPILRDTLGAIVFQDQVIEVAMAFAGFSAGEAEGLRRAMSRVRSQAAMQAYEDRFVAGAIARGADPGTAARVYAQIAGFAGFGFPKAHSAAFGLLAYQSTWLRVHYGPEFLCALLNEQPMGFYPPDTLIHEAQRRGIDVLAPSVVRSGVECTVEPVALTRAGPVGVRPSSATTPLAVRLGLGYVSGVREADVRGLVAARRRRAFRSVADLAARCSAQGDALERLAWSGACDVLCPGGRREALWKLGVAAPGVPVRGGTQLALPLDTGEAPPLRELTRWEVMVADYGSTRITTGDHPLGLMRASLGEGVLSSAALERARHGARVRVAGLVVARQRPATAKGVSFLLLEDELGTINLIVPPPVHERCRGAVRTEPVVLAEGRLERREGVLNVLVTSVRGLELTDRPAAGVRHMRPAGRAVADPEAGDLRAVVPAGHSFGRRGR